MIFFFPKRASHRSSRWWTTGSNQIRC